MVWWKTRPNFSSILLLSTQYACSWCSEIRVCSRLLAHFVYDPTCATHPDLQCLFWASAVMTQRTLLQTHQARTNQVVRGAHCGDRTTTQIENQVKSRSYYSANVFLFISLRGFNLLCELTAQHTYCNLARVPQAMKWCWWRAALKKKRWPLSLKQIYPAAVGARSL